MKLHIDIDLDYALRGEVPDHIKTLADNAIKYIIANGLFISDSSAEIKQWRFKVTVTELKETNGERGPDCH